MISFLPGPILFFISTLLLIINTIVWAGLISIGGIFKLIVPIRAFRTQLVKVMNRCMWCWATCNGGILWLITNIEWDVEGIEKLSKDGWYLLISNHVSGFDIAAQTYLLRNNLPMLKFFLKKELLYVPFLGLGCWGLDMPFMDRTSPAKLKKNPKLRGKDLETTRKVCQRFKYLPTAIINYVEGSRFTQEKHQRQNSPYRYLLRPKAGGIAFTLSAMGEQFTGLVNLTLVYPDAKDDAVLYGVMNGRVKKVVLKIDVLPVPEVNAKEYFSKAESRVEFQRDLNKLWQQKDDLIHQVLIQYNSDQLKH
ncbi:acyltransferase [Shewanella intestini]|uniref:Acyltransferase n=1 Tax=Shewanella intestini TaxID=2017544 RepID=A0ABS5I2X0_9GAMM|nr:MULTISPECIES: acyltransferase [Shewanella]MBR9728178.1 acyltransferase [Shewanella intestini]MRG36649.1 acyltransferase [Shewanella sp. XMDDZSB0408]